MAQIRLTSKGIVLLILIMSLVSFGLGFGVWQLAGPKTYNPTGSSAGEVKCSSITKQSACNSSCSPQKGSPPKSYKCKWVNGSCTEGAQECSPTTSSSACAAPTCVSGTKTYPPGATLCQEAKGGNHENTGFNCTCIADQLATANACSGDYWRCTTWDPKSCPTDTIPTVAGQCGTQLGNCVDFTGTGHTQFNVYTCPGMSYEEGKVNGCQENGKPVTVNGKFCPSVGSNFCGWVQLDAVGTSSAAGNLCFRSWFVECKDKPPVEQPPVTPPPPVVNVCEGGLVSGPTNSGNYNVGDKVVFKGSAYDKDGINKSKVVIKVDGVVVGNATVTDHPCANANADAVCTAAKGSPAVDWTYTYTVTTAGVHSFSATWEDTKGVTGASCQGSRSITANVQTNPAWKIEKSGAGVCLDEVNGVQRARVDYTITITNVGDGTGQLKDLVDTLDSKVQGSYITNSSITPSASVSGRVITWNLSGTLGQFDPNQSKTFRYSITIPESAFGTLTNTAVATPESGESFQAVEIVTAMCSPNGTPPPEVPDTALFDSAVSKVILGVVLIAVSGAYLYSDSFNISFLGLRKIKKKSFEDRVAGE